MSDYRVGSFVCCAAGCDRQKRHISHRMLHQCWFRGRTGGMGFEIDICAARFRVAHVCTGSWLCQNVCSPSARRTSRMRCASSEVSHAALTQLNPSLQNCIFYISPMYEFLHNQGHQRPVDTPAAVAPCPRRPKSEHSFEAV